MSKVRQYPRYENHPERYFPMSRATPHMRHFAKCLIVYETNENNSKTTDDFLVFEKLRPHLVALMSSGGFQALLARALTLAKAEVPGLGVMRINANGSM